MLRHDHCRASSSFFFFFNDTATTEIYTLSLHDASSDLRDKREWIHAREVRFAVGDVHRAPQRSRREGCHDTADRKSTRLNSSHLVISYAVFCLKKKKAQYNRALTVQHHVIDGIALSRHH